MVAFQSLRKYFLFGSWDFGLGDVLLQPALSNTPLQQNHTLMTLSASRIPGYYKTDYVCTTGLET